MKETHRPSGNLGPLFFCLFAIICCQWDTDVALAAKKEAEGLTVGALYYLWWGLLPGEKNTWVQGYSLSPLLGEYSSRDRGVAEEHLRWATQHGINLFEVSWAGPGRRDPSLDNDDIDLALRQGLLKAPSIQDIKFLLVYETEKTLIQEAKSIGYKDIPGAFIADITYASDTYFDHPSYFKLGGSPVVMIWKAKAVLNTLIKESGGDLSEVFQEIEKRIGQDVFWVSLGEDLYDPNGPDLNDPMLRAIDAVCPLLGDSFPPGETRPWREYLDKVSTSYALWVRGARKAGFLFIPSALPGFDDRAFKAGQNRLLRLDPQGFHESLSLAKEMAKEGSNWFSIYGFNEWFESGAIEPTKEYGLRFLEALKEAVD
ncbi:MAG: hypothetical protein Q6354_05370 [Candidatus Brocadiales bacterium]|nr:hypothetical protein [Candidatus Brocadiales bacterium]